MRRFLSLLHRKGITSALSKFVPYPLRKFYINRQLARSVTDSDINEIKKLLSFSTRVVVFMPYHDWNFLKQRYHHIAEAFAKSGYSVMFGTRKIYDHFSGNILLLKEGLALFNLHPQSLLRYLQNVSESITLISYTPFISWPEYPKSNSRIFRIFDMADHPSIYTRVAGGRRIINDIAHMVRTSHLITVTSDPLRSTAREMGAENIVVVPNGVDISHFRSALNKSTDPPSDLKPALSTGKPLIFFHGFFGSWIDAELIIKIARQTRDIFSFVLIGPDPEGNVIPYIKKAQLKNVFWLGEKKYEDIPLYIRHASCGIIPFDKSEIAVNSNPMKIYEYFALGIPVVSTPLAHHVERVFTADSPEKFVEAIAEALNTREKLTDELKRIAESASWDRYVKSVEKFQSNLRIR